jgi:AbiTii
MTLIEKIIDDLTDSSKTLADALLKTKVLASRVQNKELLVWADKELVGFRESDDLLLPEYRRKGKQNFYFSYTRGGNFFGEQHFPLTFLKDPFRTEFLYHKFKESIQTLEELATGKQGDLIGREFAADMCAVLTGQLEKHAGNIRIHQFKTTLHISEITQVLATVRSKLLDFMLRLENEFPDLDKLIQDKIMLKDENREKVDRLVHQVIIQAKDGNTIVTGNNNTVG